MTTSSDASAAAVSASLRDLVNQSAAIVYDGSAVYVISVTSDGGKIILHAHLFYIILLEFLYLHLALDLDITVQYDNNTKIYTNR